MVGSAPAAAFSSEVVGVVYLVMAAGLLALLREPIRQVEKPGSKGFALAVVAISLWPLSHGISAFVADRGLSIVLWNVRLLAAGLVSVGWFLLAVEFTTQRLPSRRVLFGLGGYLLCSQLLTWSNAAHELVLTSGTTVEGTILVPEFGPGFWLLSVANYGLIVAASAILTAEWVSSRGLRRQQSGVLAVAVAPPIVANLLSILAVVDTAHDLTPFGLVGSGLVLSWALYRMEVLDIVPVGRNVAVQVMQDAVVTVDPDDRVVDCNPRARTTFDAGTDYYGVDAREFFAPLPDATVEELLDDAQTTQTEVTVSIDGERRHLSLSASPIAADATETAGTVLVLRDITELKHREEELDVLRQVLTRVLRHDLRTDLNRIHGYASLLAEDHDDDRIDEIIDASEALIDTGEKTRHIDRIVRPGTDTEPVDLTAAVEDAVGEVEATYPDATTAVTAPETCTVRTTPGFSVVAYNLLENACEHATVADPEVRVAIEERDSTNSGEADERSEDGAVVLCVSDDGPGIPEEELSVLAERAENPLSHGSGLGLWLVNWWADRAGADLAFDSDGDGTEVTIRLPRAAQA